MSRSTWMLTVVVTMAFRPCAAGPPHVWEKQELTFTATREMANPYVETTIWVDLTGPDFKKRVYGFWDGDRTFKVRLVATEPGVWKWHSGSYPARGGPGGQERLVRGPRTGPSRRSGKTRCAAASCASTPEPPCAGVWRMAPRSSSWGIRGGPPAPTALAGMTMTSRARLAPPPASRTTSATAKIRASTWWGSSPHFRTGPTTENPRISSWTIPKRR